MYRSSCQNFLNKFITAPPSVTLNRSILGSLSLPLSLSRSIFALSAIIAFQRLTTVRRAHQRHHNMTMLILWLHSRCESVPHQGIYNTNKRLCISVSLSVCNSTHLYFRYNLACYHMLPSSSASNQFNHNAIYLCILYVCMYVCT